MAAVVSAPIVEEFLFRGIVQGWMERILVDHPVPAEIAMPTEAASTSADESQQIPASTPVEAANAGRPSWAPIVCSSLLFAFAHIGHGPDPIPIFFLALGLGYLYRQTHRIWPGVVVHLLLNAFSTGLVIFGFDEVG
jgi:membrane protease YdiL (CAAX protease family)